MTLKKKETQPLLNENIPFPQFLLINEVGEKAEVSRQVALERAEEAGLDLLCVSVTPPVCKLVNYYKLKKGEKKPKKSITQEIKISYNTDDNDLKNKLSKIQKLIEKGSTVKVNLVRHGREKSEEKAEVGEKICQEIIEKIQTDFPHIRLKSEIQKSSNSFYFLVYQKKSS
ncbi:MAG: translation initiation factor IF-3 [Candidatus Moeniiplasma glomeromycotorum]|nr:translation initiation factor IF-3 [Candidatus Moeniiplasma glomeromycotorum]MCE8162193.1 translation initiation factor IF-3 [Candidatus Moeniiplasma glomeromycotorum]MCE8163342.1 translation initiation factor IF-3 [Candidatus Moeniiplasma glomeromycotorum]MCE8166151.1 translation initiation factor IF-3 [Candidatus Moeniiplasma glomeromycotorum]MCE8166592.1 translation initiation factor IF-3 [Candidatus Moeniiplasma glomeromycotorum]